MMMILETVDLESGQRTVTGGDCNVCFSDDDDVGSCISQLFSMQDDQGTEDQSEKLSSIIIDIQGDDDHDNDDQLKTMMMMRECRICQLTMEYGTFIELGCSCKDDLGVAHKHCAQTWFNIKGNRNCEICNSDAVNVFTISNNVSEATTATTAVTTTSMDHNRTSDGGHRLANFFLLCVIFAISTSWLFHLNTEA